MVSWGSCLDGWSSVVLGTRTTAQTQALDGAKADIAAILKVDAVAKSESVSLKQWREAAVFIQRGFDIPWHDIGGSAELPLAKLEALGLATATLQPWNVPECLKVGSGGPSDPPLMLQLRTNVETLLSEACIHRTTARVDKQTNKLRCGKPYRHHLL